MVLKLECALSVTFTGLVKTQIEGPTPRFRTNKSDLGPENLHFDKFADDTNASGLGSTV